jgi:hypothetical protein
MANSFIERLRMSDHLEDGSTTATIFYSCDSDLDDTDIDRPAEITDAPHAEITDGVPADAVYSSNGHVGRDIIGGHGIYIILHVYYILDKYITSLKVQDIPKLFK